MCLSQGTFCRPFVFLLLSIQFPFQQHCHFPLGDSLSSCANPGARLPDRHQKLGWGAGPSIPTIPSQADMTGQLLSSLCRFLCPALRHFVSFCPFPNLVLQPFLRVYEFPNFFQYILFALYWTIRFCCLRVLTDILPT